jgi:hypothetical protein
MRYNIFLTTALIVYLLFIVIGFYHHVHAIELKNHQNKKGGGKKQSKSSKKQSKNSGKYGGGPFTSKKDGKVGKEKRFEVSADEKQVKINVQTDPVTPEKLPKRVPPPNNVIEHVPKTADEFTGCCTICVTKVYEGIALLQLPNEIEQETLRNFHREYSNHLTSYKHIEKKQSKPIFLQMETEKNHLNKGGKKSKKGKKQKKNGKKKKAKGGKGGTKSKSKGGKGGTKSTSKKSGKGGNKIPTRGIPSNKLAPKLAPKLPATGLDKGDVLQDLESKAGSVARVGQDNQKIYTGQTGTGPCCNICPTKFVPFNHPKLYRRGDLNMEDGNGINPEDGEFLMPKFIEVKEQQKAKLKGVPSGESHTGFSRCCSVCVDGADDTKRDSHGVQAFLEVKSRILTNIEEADNSNIQHQEKDNNLFTAFIEEKEYMKSPGRPGMCCTMCTATDNNGGWDDTPPFSEPMSEEQSINEEATNEESMRSLAYLRTYHHAATVSETYKQKASELEAMKKKE